MLTRRSYLAGATALAACSTAPEQAREPAPPSVVEPDGEIYPREGHPGHRITIRGKRLYVEDVGPRTAPVVVYVHGGPGSGTYPFEVFHRERIGRDVRLIMFDQRGALRSEAVADDEPFTLNDLVEDLEALRLELGVQRWTPLCSSFAGLIGTNYALKYPGALDKLIFDNPTIDIESSNRSMMEMLAVGFDRANMPDRAAAARASIQQPMSVHDRWQLFARTGRDLPVSARLDLYTPNLPPGFYFDWVNRSGLPMENWMRGSQQSQVTLWSDPACFVNYLPRLSEIRAPMLLIKGRDDYTCSPEHMAVFETLPNTEIVWFEDSGHLPDAEEPDRYAQVVKDFVRRT